MSDTSSGHPATPKPSELSPPAARFPEVPDRYLPEGVSGSTFDPVVLRAAAEAHCRHPFDHEMKVKAWLVLWLIDEWERMQQLHEGRYSPECDCCREAARIVSGNRQWPK